MALNYRQISFDAPYANVLLYGPPKSGKTTATAKAPGRKLLLNADTPNASRQAHLIAGSELLEVAVEGQSTLIDVHELVHHATRTIDTVIVDPIADLYRILLDDESDKAVRPTLNQRGNVVVVLERFCRMLCLAPVNAIFVAHELVIESEGDDGAPTAWLPYTGTSKPTLGLKLAGMVDVIGYTARTESKDEGVRYMAQLVPGNGRLGGDRFDVLGPFRELDLGEWFELIHKSATPEPVAA